MSHQAALCVVLAALAVACNDGSSDTAPEGPWSHGVTLPAAPQAQGDPALGRQILLTGNFMSCRIPYKLWSAPGVGTIIRQSMADDRARAEQYSAPQVRKRVDYDDTHFDEEALGWPFVAVPYAQADAPEQERKFIYDTNYWSQSNAGHTFGDALSDDERRAVIEYLKTL